MIPFVFIVLAFISEHPRAPARGLKAMGLSLLVGIPVSALAGDAVTGLVAGVGAGASSPCGPTPDHNWRARALAVSSLSGLRLRAGAGRRRVALLPAPIFPFTAIGVADHLSELRRERRARKE